MGTKYREVGGGAAVPLGEDIISWLRGGLNTGTFGGGASFGQYQGANPMSSTMGIAGVLNDILSGGAGNLGGSMQQMIHKDTERNADSLRARYNMGGTGYGTPAAYAESNFRAEAAPRATQAIGQMQMQALFPLLQMMMQLGGKGITQRETVAQQSPWATGAGMLMQGIGSALPFFAGGFGGGGGGLPMMPPPANYSMFPELGIR